MLGNFLFPVVVKLLFADAEYAFDGPVQRSAVRLSEFVPDFWNGVIAVMLGNVEYK